MQETNQPSRQKTQSKKKQNREKAKCYRNNKLLQDQLRKEKLKSFMYMKRWQREKVKSDINTPKTGINDTPRTKTRKLLRNLSRKQVRKTLVFHNALIDQLRDSYQNKLKKSEKRQLTTILSGSVLRKYKLKTATMKACGIDVKRGKLKSRTCLSKRICKIIQNYFERDDVSRVRTGIKQAVPKKSVRKQRRVLNDTLKNLHHKFISEAGSPYVSFSTFCRLRPFWVVFPTESDRHTCQCKLCENTEFMWLSLKKSKSVKEDNIEKLIENIVCNTTIQNCMFGNCSKCKEKQISFNLDVRYDEISWNEWTTKVEKRIIKSGKKEEEKDVTITSKEIKSGFVSDLEELFEKQIDRYKKHLYLIRTQYEYFREKRETLNDNECIVHVDFSENYVCKLATEVQSMHFGASKRQVTLHTVVFYTGKNQTANTFCTVSDSLNHGPAAIWTHLNPILRKIKTESPGVTSISFF